MSRSSGRLIPTAARSPRSVRPCRSLAGTLPQMRSGFPPRARRQDAFDAVFIVSPNHWHALLAVWVCQADEDALVEKPCSHNVVEGRRMVEAARKYDRIRAAPHTAVL